MDSKVFRSSSIVGLCLYRSQIPGLLLLLKIIHGSQGNLSSVMEGEAASLATNLEVSLALISYFGEFD